MTMNSPGSMLELYRVTQNLPHNSTPPPPPPPPAQTVELMREVGLKCISFNGIPRTINMLGAFREGLPADVVESISSPPPRTLTRTNVDEAMARGRALWDSVYRPFEDKLLDKMGASHPNLPIHILAGHYSNLLSNPPNTTTAAAAVPSTTPVVGRVLTSILAIACLRAQTGVGPQVTSHLFGLRKAYQDGTAETDVEGGEWLATDDGNRWILNAVDEIVQALSPGGGSSFAPGMGISKPATESRL